MVGKRSANFGTQFSDCDEPFRILEWKGAQQHPIYHGKNGRVGADSDRQAQDHRRGEAALPQERAEGVSQIVPHGCFTMDYDAGPVSVPIYSYRRAILGSTRAAREAGM